MPTIIKEAKQIPAPGGAAKIILEHIGRVNSDTKDVSIAHMKSPAGWELPGQTPEFDEYTVMLKGTLIVETKDEKIEVKAGETIITHKGEWVKYSSPGDYGAEYIAICVPAFSPDLAHEDPA